MHHFRPSTVRSQFAFCHRITNDVALQTICGEANASRFLNSAVNSRWVIDETCSREINLLNRWQNLPCLARSSSTTPTQKLENKSSIWTSPFADNAVVIVFLQLLLKCCFTSTETVGLLGTGAQDGHLDFHTAPELSVVTLCAGTILQPRFWKWLV